MNLYVTKILSMVPFRFEMKYEWKDWGSLDDVVHGLLYWRVNALHQPGISDIPSYTVVFTHFHQEQSVRNR